MQTDHASEAQQAASAMLDVFASVVATAFDLTITSASGEKIRISGQRPP